MKNRVLKPILQKDKKNLFGFFKNHKDIYQTALQYTYNADKFRNLTLLCEVSNINLFHL